MTTLVDLVLRAKTEGLNKAKQELDSLQQAASKSETQIDALGKAFAKGAPAIQTFALVSTAVVGTIAALAVQAVNAADRLAKLANQTNLSVERLSVIDKIAKQAGSSAKELAESADRLGAKLAKQDEESGRAAESLRLLGISTKDANGQTKSTIQLQEEVVRAVDQATNKTQAEAAAVRLLGNDYYRLRGTIRAVSEQKSSMYDLMERTGQIVTADIARESERFNDTLDNMGGLFRGLGNSIIQAALPTVNSWLETANRRIESLVVSIRRLMGLNSDADKAQQRILELEQSREQLQNKMLVQGENKDILRDLAQLDQLIEKERERLRVAKEVEDAKKTATINGTSTDGNRSSGTNNDGAAARAAAQRRIQLVEQEKQIRARQSLEAIKEYERQEAAAEAAYQRELKIQADRQLRQQFEADRAQQLADQAAEREKELLDARVRGYTLALDPAIRYREELEQLNRDYDTGAVAIDVYLAKSKELEDQIKRVGSAAKDQGPLLGELENLGKSAFDGLLGSITELAITGKNTFKDFAANILRQLAGMIVRLLVTRALMAALGMPVGPANTAAPSMNLLGGAFAKGGRPPRGRVSVVGEQGPELFVPDSAGTIIPNHQLGSQTARSVVQHIELNISVQGGNTNEETGQTVSRAVVDAMRGIVRQEIAQFQRRQAYAA